MFFLSSPSMLTIIPFFQSISILLTFTIQLTLTPIRQSKQHSIRTTGKTAPQDHNGLLWTSLCLPPSQLPLAQQPSGRCDPPGLHPLCPPPKGIPSRAYSSGELQQPVSLSQCQELTSRTQRDKTGKTTDICRIKPKLTP
jgi:hypothetical protein